MLLLFVLFSCATTPEKEIQPPEWYLNPPPDNNEYRYFAISQRASILKDIESLAGDELFARVSSALGLSESEAEKDDLSEMRKEIRSVVSGTQVQGFKLINKQVDELGTEKIIYILVQMENSRMDQLRTDLEDIFRAGSTASIYSVEAENLVSRGEVYKGALSYIKAALESAGSDNRFITEQNLRSAISLFEDMEITTVDSPETLAVGNSGVFKARLGLKSSDKPAVWKDVAVKTAFRDRKKGAVIGDRFAMLRSSETGLVTFVHPSPGFTGAGKVVMSLDLLYDTGDLSLLEKNFPEEYAKLISASDSVKVQFDFSIISSAPTVLTGVYIIDSDFLRKPLDSRQTQQGLTSSLQSAGFNTLQLDLDRKYLFDLNDEELLRDLPYLINGDYKRTVFGVAQIVEFDDAAAGFTVVTEARVRVLDLESGEILFDETLSKRVQGGESQATINTSFKELGKSFAALLMDKLP
ncbi:hypothetical protein [Spirochaeta isovalerica]|uniref:Lipoprotein n=1 Tax=Spirochaeta isovalerica TaxID=150 RepID=A0A841RGB8_9SPIO|nr:hypothetical protein [Spirochaeta isovalerica]MBB6482626.1 hypothetical protein [Spirochaeta isovalerica]